MVAEVTVDVSSNSTGGSDSSSKGVVKELKELTSLLKKGFKTSASGVLGGGGGLLSRLLGGAAGTALAGGLLASQVLSSGSEAQAGTITSGTSYEKFIGDNGESLIAETDTKTGDILNILTEREAKEQGILSATGRLKNKYTDFESKFDEITKDLERRKDSVVLNTDKAIELGILHDEELKLQRQINNALSSKLANLGGSPIRSDVDVVGIATSGTGINIVAASEYNANAERLSQGLLEQGIFNPAAFNFFR